MQQPTESHIIYRDYPVQYFSSSSTEIEGIERGYIWKDILSRWIENGSKKTDYHNLVPLFGLFKIDSSSILPYFGVKTETLDEESTAISEKDIMLEVVERDFMVKMPPKKRRKVRVHVRNVRKGTPSLVEPGDFVVME